MKRKNTDLKYFFQIVDNQKRLVSDLFEPLASSQLYLSKKGEK